MLKSFPRSLLAVSLLLALLSGCAPNTVNSGYWPKHFPQYKYIRLGIIDTRYVIVGSGPPLLLIHGLGAGLDMFEQNIPELAKHFTVYALDLRGMGYSSKPEGFDYSAPMQILHVLEFMQHFELKRVNVWGHSMGGFLALNMAIYTPEKIDRLIVSDPPVYQDKFPNPIMRLLLMPVVGKLVEWFPSRYAVRTILQDVFYDDARMVTKERVDRAYQVFTLPGGPKALRQYVRSIHFDEGTYIGTLFKDIKAPTLILWGEEDKWFPANLGERLQKEIPNSQLVIIPKAGHQSIEEKPDEINAAVLSFLSARYK